ncbi:hypothetical protein HPB50_023133 [Hyalomma asiaticum]|uniref:Uncharacterized protein n=1 Tax=Hyalomma asiaticum TaxID=266040 RepID=A0ACB7TPU8_HYAAI|nr:hypothetical protein HPB50_023133 [Hyalomma asiaticum]
MEHHDAVANPTVAVLEVKLLPFWTSDPALWFVQVESQFTAHRITADTTKYHDVVANIPPVTASEVRDILLALPAEDAYTVLKRTLIRHLTPLEPQHLEQLLHEVELGDRRPSQLLRHIQQAPARLPATVRIGITASAETDHDLLDKVYRGGGETDIYKIAELADRLMAVTTPALATVLAEASPYPTLLEIRKEFSRLANTIAALQASESQRTPRRAAQHQHLCWYHRKFRGTARKCVPPCEKSGNAPSQH